jgi:hypothetical protein
MEDGMVIDAENFERIKRRIKRLAKEGKLRPKKAPTDTDT